VPRRPLHRDLPFTLLWIVATVASLIATCRGWFMMH
jgi:hypothetical protein